MLLKLDVCMLAAREAKHIFLVFLFHLVLFFIFLYFREYALMFPFPLNYLESLHVVV